ncbi:hypothetical protein [Deinococcus peraridilitoris]|uniref:Uncharacterized protein n=1 Tax=Deinococcus peraridilitoris (strain DSM 19664 / LMG 22246 / CIP 109416 / KR-200) TaxID=937777 RepID=L0A757_DEIPD|nr:hypothetical protein [Deinococcus peraridilitoris]AFZ69693.1 hypothetical protein Deipe_4353 [Deinococcus peraridilitoris DSM 19664]
MERRHREPNWQLVLAVFVLAPIVLSSLARLLGGTQGWLQRHGQWREEDFFFVFAAMVVIGGGVVAAIWWKRSPTPLHFPRDESLQERAKEIFFGLLNLYGGAAVLLAGGILYRNWYEGWLDDARDLTDLLVGVLCFGVALLAAVLVLKRLHR